MFKVFLEFLFIISFFSFRFVKPVTLGGDKNYAEKNKINKEEKKKNFLKLIKQTPENNSVEFKDSKIELEFNDKIELDVKKIRFQPFLLNHDNVFKYKINGNKLRIDIINQLNKDTTYQINFTDAIKDLDGNSCENIVVTFATGKELNKGTLNGHIKDLMTNKDCENCLVALYRTDRNKNEGVDKKKTFAHILNEENPDYFIRTDEKGQYKINNIANGEYFLCAGETTAEKLICDPKKNKYGFSSEPIIIQNNEITKDIDILLANIEKFKIIEQKTDENDFIIKFDRQVKDFSIKLLINSRRFSESLKSAKINEERNTISLNINNFDGLLPNIDHLPCEITAYDEYGEMLKEKINIHFKNIDEKKGIEKNNIKIESLEKILTTQSLINFKIISEKKIENIDTTKIEMFLKNKIGTKYPIPITRLNIDISNKKEVFVKYDKTIEEIFNIMLTQGDNAENQLSQMRYDDIKLEILIKKQGIFFSDRSTNEEISQTFIFIKNFGSISGNINVKNKHFKVQLLNDKYEVIAEKQDINTFSFEKIKKGEYFVRLLIWDIKNPQWSCGNIFYKKEHDLVFFYDKKIDIINNLNIPNINFDIN